MNWNSSGNDNDPWGGRNNDQGPPDLDKLIQNMINNLKKMFGLKSGPRAGSGGSGSQQVSFLVGVAAVIVLVLWIIAGFFIVAPAEQAVVLRFGKYVDTLEPGPHWVPRLIENYHKVNVQSVYSYDFAGDFLTKSSSASDKPKPIIKVTDVGAVPAGDDDTDKNVVYVEMSVQYRISDPRLYLFNVVDGKRSLEQAAQSALSQVIGRMKLNDVLTKGRDELAIQVSTQLRHLMNEYQAGIDVVVANIRKAQAPEEVADAFLDVVQAGQDEQRYIQQAQAYASKVVPIAEGTQSRILADAEAYRQQVVLNARANVANYEAILGVYKASPQVTRERLYLDALQSVMSHTGKLLVDVPKGGQSVFYLPLDKLANKTPAPYLTPNKLTAEDVDGPASMQEGNIGSNVNIRNIEKLYSAAGRG